MRPLTITTADGRSLDVELAGPEDGRVVLLHTGTPSAGSAFPQMSKLAAERGLRHLTYSRPGYGDSDPLPGRSVADCRSDVEAILDALGVERFFTIGWSGGGPHALACAALLGDRTIAAATLAGVAPADAAGLDFYAGMGEDNLEEFAAARGGEEMLRPYLQAQREGILSVGVESMTETIASLLSDVDRAALTGDFGAYLLEASRHGLRHGVEGWLEDDLAFLAGWGFVLDSISVPVTIWQGEQDRFVPFAHGQWLAANVAGAEPRLLADEGHLSLTLGRYGDVLDELLAAG